jgi:hypothetical protein
MHGDAGGGLQLLSINGGENSYVVVGSASGSNQTMVFIDHFHEVADDQRNSLDSLEFFLGAQFFPE